MSKFNELYESLMNEGVSGNTKKEVVNIAKTYYKELKKKYKTVEKIDQQMSKEDFWYYSANIESKLENEKQWVKSVDRDVIALMKLFPNTPLSDETKKFIHDQNDAEVENDLAKILRPLFDKVFGKGAFDISQANDPFSFLDNDDECDPSMADPYKGLPSWC